jgi:hypothetical protein
LQEDRRVLLQRCHLREIAFKAVGSAALARPAPLACSLSGYTGDSAENSTRRWPNSCERTQTRRSRIGVHF